MCSAVVVSRSFTEETRALKMWSTVASHWKLITADLEQSWKLILLQLHEKLPKNSVLTLLWLLATWSKLERWKSSISGCLMSWPQIKQIVVLKKCHLLVVYATSMNHLSTKLWCMMKSGFYTTSNSHLSGWTEKKLQSTSPNQVC